MTQRSIYIINIIIFSKTLKKHEQYFRQFFIILQINNISIKLEKIFWNYSNIQFLNEKMNFFDFATTKNKLKIISKFQFSRILRQLKIYLNLTNWFREYISHYIEIVKLLQNRKTKLFRLSFIKKNARKTYSTRTKVLYFIEQKKTFFFTFQFLFFKSLYLVYLIFKKQIYVDLNNNKKFDFEAIIYHVKKT